MINSREFMVRAQLEANVLRAWIEAGWLRPKQEAAEQWFSEMDIARAALIRDLGHNLGVNEHGVDVVLDLLDQVHGLRRAMRDLLVALRDQPEGVRREIVGQIQARRRPTQPQP